MKIKSHEDLDTALLALGKCQVYIATKEAEMNAEIQGVKDRYATLTAEESGKAADIETAIEEYCQKNKSEFEKQRTLTLNHGKVAFRTNPPKLVQLNKKWKVESTIAFLAKLHGRLFLREKTEINKEAVLAAYAGEKLDDEKLAAVGLRVEQEESFNVEPNWSELQPQNAA